MGVTLDTRPDSASAGRWWERLAERFTGRFTSRPGDAARLLWICWGLTRLALALMVIFGHAYCDPQFYHYAGELAGGRWPYRDVTVEYPPLALVLILLPALPLIALGGIFPDVAPRSDPAFALPPAEMTHIPHPDPARYGAYATTFAVEMLLLDALTLWLVTRAARRLIPGEQTGLRSGLLYVGATLACGALLQKFDLVAGGCMLLAVLLLVAERPRLAWATLAAATLIKGFPLLAAPLFVGYALVTTDAPVGATRGERLRAAWSHLIGGIATFCGVVAAWTLPIALVAGPDALLKPLLYQGLRGTEIESLYANAMLLVAWLPGLGVTTEFNGADLSRVVLSPLNGAAEGLSTALLVALVLLACGAAAYAARPAVRSMALKTAAIRSAARVPHVPLMRSATMELPQVLVAGTVAVLLGFVLAFRALPLHYLLIVLPLTAVLRPPGRRLNVALWAAVGSVAILGQYLTVGAVWHALVLVEPTAIGALTLRNLAYVATFVVVIVALWQSGARLQAGLRAAAMGEGGAHMGSTLAPPEPRQQTRERARELAPARRLVTAWRRLLRTTPPVPGFTPRGEDVVAHALTRISPLSLVLGAGIASALIYLGFVAAFPITVWWSHPQLAIEMGRLTGYSPLAAAAYVFAILALFACQFLILGAAGRLPQMVRPTERAALWARRAVFLFPALFVIVLIWMQPITTTDLYGYVARGYLFAHLHLNPMITPATALPGGLFVNRPAAPYGPLWLLIAGSVARLAGENLLLNMLLFKLIAAAATIGSMALVDSLARRLFPTRRLRVYVLFAWSPLLLFEAIGNGHNDIVMMLCVLLAFTLMLRGRARTAFAFLVLGGLIKYVSLALVPLWLVYELRQRAATSSPELAQTSAVGADPARHLPARERVREQLRQQTATAMHTLQTMNRREASVLLVSAGLTAAALFAVCYAPFWVGMRTFTGIGQQLRPLYYNGSVVQFIAAPLELLTPPTLYPALDKTVRLVFYIAFACYAVLQTRRLWLLGTRATMRDVITASAKVVFAALVLITFWFQPWYIVWLIPLAALSRQAFVRRQSTMLAAGALLTYAISNYLPVGMSGIGRDLFVQFFEVLVTFCPLLLLRAAPNEDGWGGVVRRYVRQVGEGLRIRARWWERVMLALILVVAALLRVLRLGNPFAVVSSGRSGALQELGADFKLYLADPRGLHAPFVALQGLMLHLFGRTPLAVLLPSAIIGTLTVFVIYLLALEVTRQASPDGHRGVALLAALFAATSSWHVSLSRSGMEVVLLPLLICTGIYWLLLALRLNAARVVATSRPLASKPQAAQAVGAASTSDSPAGAPATQTQVKTATSREPGWMGDERVRRCVLLFVGCGIATGLACDIAPGLWLLPLLVAGILVVWRWRLPHSFMRLRVGLLALLGTALLSGAPAIWTFLSSVMGFPKGSAVLAHSTLPAARPPSVITLAFWGQVAANAGDTLHILASQDFSAGYPANGGAPILPTGLGWLFFLGVALLLVRWRDMTSLAALLLIALPLVASVVVGTPAAVVEAAAVLPATCLVPALALRAVGNLFAHLPIALDRINGARIFSSPEQIGRILLLVFLLVSTVCTFFWYFAATMPSTPPNTWIPT